MSTKKVARKKSTRLALSGEFTESVPFDVISDEDATTAWIDGDLCDEVYIKPGLASEVHGLIKDHGHDWWRYVPEEWKF